MSKAAVTLSAVGLVLIAAALLGLWQVQVEVTQLRSQFADVMQRMIDQRFAGVTTKVDAIGAKVDEQTAIINRGLGVIIPYKLPDDVSTRLASVQEQISGAVLAPVDQVSMEQMRVKLASIVDALPPWAQEEILPTLVPLRWELEGLWVLANASEGNLAALSGRAAILDELLANRPLGTSQPLADRLVQAQQETEEQIATAERADAVEKAKVAITAPKDFTDVATAIRLLSVYDDDETQALKADLNRVILVGSLQSSLSNLKNDRKSYRTIKDPILREFGLARTAESTMDLRLRVLSAGLAGSALGKEVEGLGQSVTADVSSAIRERQNEQAQNLKKYQVWALKEIQSVSKYKEIEDAAIAKIPDTADRVNPVSQAARDAKAAAQRTLREAMVLHLAPIDQGLLDVAVGDWFRKVYQDRFAHLTDDKEQLALVTAFANTPKKSPDDVP